MLNSKQMKIAQKQINLINMAAVMSAVTGSIKDIKEGVHPATASIIPLWQEQGTIAAVTAMEGWDTNPEIVDHIVGSIMGRFGHFLLLEVGIDIGTASIEQAMQLMSATDTLQEKAVKKLVGDEKYEAYKANAQQPGSIQF